ncbi:hypothetical protein AB9F41_37770, partial [Rhizobium leguminosarum]|uniref:hypothetical protein n=1 Tax=Rhizobium leguminosarum TaxID=384 RepID=UPI003F94AEDA
VDVSDHRDCRKASEVAAKLDPCQLLHVDVRTLLSLRKLEYLRLNTGIDHIEDLLDLPRLKEVRVLNNGTYDDVTTAGT